MVIIMVIIMMKYDHNNYDADNNYDANKLIR